MFLRPGAADFEPINQNEPVFVSDFILTDPADPNSKIWWRSKTPVRMDASLGVDSLLGLVAFSMEQTHSTFFGQVPKGTIRFRKKLPETTPPSSFVIATETALVQVVPTKRTADFVVESFEDSTTVTVLWGKVLVTSVSEQFTEAAILESCQRVVVERDQNPSEIQVVSREK